MVDPGPQEMEYVLPQSKEEKYYTNKINEPLLDWSDRKNKNHLKSNYFHREI